MKTFVITRAAGSKHRVLVQERTEAGLVFHGHLGTLFPNLNTAVARINSLFPGSKKEILL